MISSKNCWGVNGRSYSLMTSTADSCGPIPNLLSSFSLSKTFPWFSKNSFKVLLANFSTHKSPQITHENDKTINPPQKVGKQNKILVLFYQVPRPQTRKNNTIFTAWYTIICCFASRSKEPNKAQQSKIPVSKRVPSKSKMTAWIREATAHRGSQQPFMAEREEQMKNKEGISQGTIPNGWKLNWRQRPCRWSFRTPFMFLEKNK